MNSYSINQLCQIAKVSCSSYYKWLNRKTPPSETLNNQIARRVEEIHLKHPDKGYRRIRDDLSVYHNIYCFLCYQ